MSNESSPAASLITATVEQLQRHAPFDAVDVALLRRIAAHLSLRYFAAGALIIAPGHGLVRELFIIQRGQVDGKEPGSAGAAALTLTEGECFPLGALISRRATTLEFRAVQDTFCYVLDSVRFEDLMDLSRPFREFGTMRLAKLVEQSRRGVQSEYAARATETRSMASPLRSALRRAPVTAPPDQPLGQALRKMHELRIGSIVVVDADGKPVGIFTERDVLDRVALPGTSLEVPLSAVMTPQPFALPASAPLFEAAQAMTRQRFRHVLIMDEGVLAGVISERDLFTLQRLSPGEISKAIHNAASVDELVFAAGEVRRLAASMLAQGVAAEQLTQFVTTLNDSVVERAVSLGARASPPPDVPFCWMGLGSEGRMEQTLATDQDNALIFAPGGTELASTRAAFLAFADQVNRILDRCGFPLCTGDIMARNPLWCLTEQQWRETFIDWMRNANPQALLNAAIFFDFRALAGTAVMAQQLREWLNETVTRYPAFLRQMAQNALQVRPPLGVLRDFIADDSEMPGTIDLKRYGARPFIDAGRIFALAHGVANTNTAERLRVAAPRMRMGEEEVASAVDGFHFVQLLRLRNQDPHQATDVAEVARRAAHPNRVDPEHLSALDRRILKEALRQARKLQSRLELDYQV